MCGIGANYNSRHSHRSAQLEKSMEHNSFILHHKQWCQLSQLTDEELGKIMRAIYLYRTEWEIMEMDRLLTIVFTSIREQLDYDIVKWEETRKERSEAGKRSWESRRKKKWTKRTNVPFVEQNEQTWTKWTVSVPVSVPVPDSVSSDTNTLSTITEQALKPDNRNPGVQMCIDTIKAFCKERQILYDSGDDRMFAKHIVTAREFWEKAEQFGKERIELAIFIIEIAERDTFWRGKIAWPKNIYQKATQILNLGRSMYLQEQEPNTHYQII